MSSVDLCGAGKFKPVFTGESIWTDLDINFDPVRNVFTDTNNCTYRQLHQDVPALTPLYTGWETRFNALPFVHFASKYFWVSFVICAVYLVFCYVGQLLMKDRKPFDIKPALAAWNLLLAVFSAIGFCRTAPHLLYYLYTRGFYASVCSPAEPAYGQGAAGLWTMLFIFSKIPELIDTVFIVLRKRKLIFLHWYHHVTVLLYCWHSYATRSSAGLYFVAMNYGVHALMYYYYYLTAMGVRVSWDMIVTTLQISQMFVGIGICAAVYYFETYQNLYCDITRENYIAGLVMYASYAALFVWFALGRYVFPSLSSPVGSHTKSQRAAASTVDAAGMAMTSPSPDANGAAGDASKPANLRFYGTAPKSKTQ